MKLFSPYKLGDIELKNRLVMAPMTRCRAVGNLANELMAEYYSQRANAGLIVTEGTSPALNGLGYARIPGLFNRQQASVWKHVTDAVHAANGRIFVQLMHTGRVSHLYNMPEGAEVIAPSAVTFAGNMWTDEEGELPCSAPRAMSDADIELVIDEFVRSAEYAIEAGFDGVELHAANGYLINQFLDAGTNRRIDHYGGSASNRNRFAIELAMAVVAAIGQNRTGIRLSPHGVFNGMSEYDGTTEQYGELATRLGEIGLIYIHLVDQSALGMAKPLDVTIDKIRNNFRAVGNGAIILNGGYDKKRAEGALSCGEANLIAFGRPYISNPDLLKRLRNDSDLAVAADATFYTPGREGYTDYLPVS